MPDKYGCPIPGLDVSTSCNDPEACFLVEYQDRNGGGIEGYYTSELAARRKVKKLLANGAHIARFKPYDENIYWDRFRDEHGGGIHSLLPL